MFHDKADGMDGAIQFFFVAVGVDPTLKPKVQCSLAQLRDLRVERWDVLLCM